MTPSALPELLEAFPIPEGAIVLPARREAQEREMDLAIAALRQAMASRRLVLPLGPELDAADPDRLLVLNHFSIQLMCGGYPADRLRVPIASWKQADTAPQLLVVALVDEENAVVWFPGVLTAQDPQAQAWLEAANMGEQQELDLDPLVLRGGIDRLFTVVQLLEPDALPRFALATAAATLPGTVVRVVDWLRGQLDPALQALGASFDALNAQASGLAAGTAAEPVLAFRSSGALEGIEQALAVLAIPLGIGPDRQLLSGNASETCIERFRLLLIPSGAARPDALLLRLSPELAGDILPDGLLLEVEQGGLSQSLRSEQSSRLDLRLPASGELIQVTLSAPGSAPLQLPPLQLPR